MKGDIHEPVIQTAISGVKVIPCSASALEKMQVEGFFEPYRNEFFGKGIFIGLIILAVRHSIFALEDIRPG
jgi:hypothetical protein